MLRAHLSYFKTRMLAISEQLSTFSTPGLVISIAKIMFLAAIDVILLVYVAAIISLLVKWSFDFVRTFFAVDLIEPVENFFTVNSIQASDCVICMEEFASANGSDVVRLRCGHTFHVRCIVGWAISSSTNTGRGLCPICRQPIAIPQGSGWKMRTALFLKRALKWVAICVLDYFCLLAALAIFEMCCELL